MESHTVPENVKIIDLEHGLPDRRPGARFRVRPAGIEPPPDLVTPGI